jgi:hypothetical protein
MLRRLLAIAFMAFFLTGGLVVEMHDHGASTHQQDCKLCRIVSHDADVPAAAECDWRPMFETRSAVVASTGHFDGRNLYRAAPKTSPPLSA